MVGSVNGGDAYPLGLGHTEERVAHVERGQDAFLAISIDTLAGDDFDQAPQDVVALAVGPAFAGLMRERRLAEALDLLGYRLEFPVVDAGLGISAAEAVGAGHEAIGSFCSAGLSFASLSAESFTSLRSALGSSPASAERIGASGTRASSGGKGLAGFEQQIFAGRRRLPPIS